MRQQFLNDVEKEAVMRPIALVSTRRVPVVHGGPGRHLRPPLAAVVSIHATNAAAISWQNKKHNNYSPLKPPL